MAKDIYDPETFESLQHQYTAEEMSTILFSSNLYLKHLNEGRMSYDDEFEQNLRDGLEAIMANIDTDHGYISPIVSKLVCNTVLRYTATLSSMLTAGDYVAVCDELQIKPFDLFYHGLVARNIRETPPELVPIGE